MSRHQQHHASPTSSNSSAINPLTPSPTLSFTTLTAAHQHAFMNSARVAALQTNVAPQAAAPTQRGGAQQGAGSKVKTAKSRKRVNTAEKRATHNAVERQRREALNGRFLDLARLLPGLATVRRPSKSNIVNNSISHLSVQRNSRLSAARELRSLLAERDALLAEVNDWRGRNGVDRRDSSGVSAAVEEVLKVEEETFGVFSAGFGNDDEDDEDGGDNEGSFDGGVVSAMDRTSFSSENSTNVGSAFNQAYNGLQTYTDNTAAANAASNLTRHMNGTFFPAGPSPINVKTEALTPGSSDANSPISASAQPYHVDGHGSSPQHTEKVTSWAAEQLLTHLRHQQRQAEEEQFQQLQQERRDSVGPQAIPLAAAHHGSNPFTANLLASIAAQQQRSSFDMQSNYSQEDSPKSYSYPPGPSHLGYPGFLPAQPQSAPSATSLDAWRQYALTQYSQQPSSFPINQQGGRGNGGAEPSLDEIAAAVRVGMGYGLGMTIAPQQTTSLWGMTPEAESFTS